MIEFKFVSLGIKPVLPGRQPVILVEEVNEERSNRLKGKNQVLRRAKVADICTIDV